MELCKETPQNPEFHSEGNVYEHVLMVIDELKSLYGGLNDREKDLVSLAAFLHDVGKTKTTKFIDNKWTSPGHSKSGYHIALELLEEVDLPFEDKLTVLNLILYHSKPQFSLTQENIDKYVISFSLDVNNKLLSLLNEADAKGRICNDKDDFLINTLYYRERCIELDCYEHSFKFNSNLIKFNYLVKGTHHYLDNSFDNTKSKVYIMSGIMGSGKDYYISKNLSGLSVISLDEIRKELKIKPTDEQGKVVQTAKERAKVFLRKGESFVWNATNITYDMRSKLIDTFLPYNPYITIIYKISDLKTVLKQNKERESVVPDNVIFKSFRKLEIPKQYEAHEVLYV